MPVTSYSRTPSDNSASPPNGFPEGMAPSAVNNTARQLMTDIVNEASKGQARVLSSVSGTNTITATMTPDLDAYAAGMIVVFTPAGNNTGATTLNIDSLGALDVQKADGDALVSGDLVSGIPAVLVLDSGADDWILLNPMTPNATGLDVTGNASIGGTLSVTGAVTLNGALTTDNSTADEAGFKGLPQNIQTGNYTLVLSDAGKAILSTGSGATITIPANASVAFPIGTTICIVVGGSGSARTLAITSDILYLAGAGTTGSRTLSTYALVTIHKISATEWFVTGTGLS